MENIRGGNYWNLKDILGEYLRNPTLIVLPDKIYYLSLRLITNLDISHSDDPRHMLLYIITYGAS